MLASTVHPKSRRNIRSNSRPTTRICASETRVVTVLEFTNLKTLNLKNHSLEPGALGRVAFKTSDVEGLRVHSG